MGYRTPHLGNFLILCGLFFVGFILYYPGNNRKAIAGPPHKMEIKPINEEVQHHVDIGFSPASNPKSRKTCKSCLQRPLPHVIMIGSKKCGTGQFIGFFAGHPDVCRYKGEIHFFDKNYKLGLSWYRRKLPLCPPPKLQIEKTPRYFVTPLGPERIHQMNQTIKMLLIVRDPTKRLISDYVHSSRRAGSFEEVVLNSTGGLDMNYEPVPTGIYYQHMLKYLNLFNRSQFHIIDGEAFVKDPLPELKKAERFLSLPSYFNKSQFVFSEKKGFYCKSVRGKAVCAGRTKGRPHPEVSEDLIKKIQDFYRPYNKEFFKLVNVTFDWA